MSYGKELKIDGIDYLIEIFDKHIYVAKKNGEDDYTSIYEGDYASMYLDCELAQLEKLDYDDQLYAMVIKALDGSGAINSMASYQKYLFSLIESGHTKEDILSSSSDEALVYEVYYPLDKERTNFESLSSSIVDDYQNIKQKY